MVLERWLQIKTLFDAAHEKPAGERAHLLDEACGADQELRREVESLLACEESAAGFLESAGAGAARAAPLPNMGEPVPAGERMGPYTILEPLGAGGMGQVYKAHDSRLDRHVAAKFLSRAMTGDPSAHDRFQREARAASALNHPNICTVHDAGEFQGRSFIVMELLEGRSLKDRIAGKPLPLAEFASVSRQVCAALEAAHATGIVHRDVKPANLFVTESGRVKILDFGLAKRGAGADGTALQATGGARNPSLTASGTITGTLAYMSPEQALGEDVDARSDIFSLGVVLYEMATGRPPFRGKTAAGILGSILTEAPTEPSQFNPAVPARVERLILKALEKDRGDRYQSIASLSADLDEWQRAEAAAARRRLLRRPQFAAPAVLLLVAVIAAGTLLGIRNRRAKWARNVALPEIAKLVNREDFDPAFRLARQAGRYLAGDPEFLRLQRHYQIVQTIQTDPPGAEVYAKGYVNVNAEWIHLGKSPISSAPFPNRNTRWRATKDGYEPVEAAFVSYVGLGHPGFRLHRVDSVPPGMAGIPGGSVQVRGLPPVQLQDYWLDKYEVSNRQFKEFVDRGGYRCREYWKHPFVKGGNVLAWEQAVTEFRDETGWPGPATWSHGSYPDGQQDFPVSGVSWYEAAAYAEFAGKHLPTFYHWTAAVGKPLYADIVRLSNFSGKGPAPAGSHPGLGRYGHYDMAGNVREWCWNEAEGASQPRRYILGGSWSEQSYTFYESDAASPFDRSAINGFRCAKYEAPPPDALYAPLKELSRDYSKEKPANDAVFQAYRSFYSYDRTDLKATVEAVDGAPPHWRRETVTLSAAYDNERLIAHLFLPKNGVPPHQAVVYFPCNAGLSSRSSEDLELMIVEFLVRSGRAVLYPVYHGMYERHSEPAGGGSAFLRDRVIRWSKDFSRSVDYLETRPDIDRARLAFYGLSLGAVEGLVLTAIDGRMKAIILHGGGLPQHKRLAEADPVHFAPRVRAPVLMIGGRLDSIHPVETCQRPLLRLLGAPAKDKRLVIVDRGHSVYPTSPVINESLAWLDRYLGPVGGR